MNYMTKSIKVFLSTAFFAVLAVSCRESIEPAYPAVECEGTMDICVNGLMGEYTQQDAVKSSLVNNIRVAWAAGDVVYVFDGSKYLGKLTAALDKKAGGQTDEDRYAKLSGTISAPATTPCVLSLVHSSLMTEPAAGAAVSELSIDMSAQSTATVPFVAYAILDYTGESITDAIVPFQFATSVIKVNCTGLEANTAITSATLSNVNTACKLTLSGSAAPTVSGGTNGTITRTNDEYFAATKVNAEGEAVFQIAVPALETASSARVLTVFQDSYKAKDKKFTTNSLAAATSVNTVCQLVGPPVGALKGEFSVSATKKVYFSKGNLWADSDNVLHFEDAQWKSTPDSGGLMDANHVSHFTWSDKVAGAVYDSYSGSNLFCDEANKQSVDGSDKIYYALSITEWQYLFAWNSALNDGRGGFDENLPRYGLFNYGVTVCGKANCVVLLPDGWQWGGNVGTDWQKGKNDVVEYNEETTIKWSTMQAAGAVCLPAAGCRSSGNASNVINVGSGGFYWSSTYDDNGAYYVVFRSSEVSPDQHATRDFGHSVRLITECQ